MTAIGWFGALRPTNVLWHLENQSRGGGLSLEGSEQIVASGSGRWRARVEVSAIRASESHREDAVLALRTLIAEMEGRVGEVLLPSFDAYVPRDSLGRKFSACAVAPLGGGIYFFEHWGFEQTEIIHATLEGAAALRATTIVADILEGQGLRPGQYFGIGERLYRAKSVTPTTGSLVSIRFGPPLREAVADGERVILDRPVCRTRFASDDTGELEIQMGRYGTCTLDFVEAL